MNNVGQGLLCWGRANKKCIDNIFGLINRALRCILFKKHDSNLRELKTQKNVKNIYVIYLGMFKFNNSLLPANFGNYCKSVKKLQN